MRLTFGLRTSTGVEYSFVSLHRSENVRRVEVLLLHSRSGLNSSGGEGVELIRRRESVRIRVDLTLDVVRVETGLF